MIPYHCGLSSTFTQQSTKTKFNHQKDTDVTCWVNWLNYPGRPKWRLSKGLTPPTGRWKWQHLTKNLNIPVFRDFKRNSPEIHSYQSLTRFCRHFLFPVWLWNNFNQRKRLNSFTLMATFSFDTTEPLFSPDESRFLICDWVFLGMGQQVKPKAICDIKECYSFNMFPLKLEQVRQRENGVLTQRIKHC